MIARYSIRQSRYLFIRDIHFPRIKKRDRRAQKTRPYTRSSAMKLKRCQERDGARFRKTGRRDAFLRNSCDFWKNSHVYVHIRYVRMCIWKRENSRMKETRPKQIRGSSTAEKTVLASSERRELRKQARIGSRFLEIQCEKLACWRRDRTKKTYRISRTMRRLSGHRQIFEKKVLTVTCQLIYEPRNYILSTSLSLFV